MKKRLHRFRFFVPDYDSRPLDWPPPGPHWQTGIGDGYAVEVAYAHSEEQLLRFWPDAYQIDDMGYEEITFTERFPKPDWWPVEEWGLL